MNNSILSIDNISKSYTDKVGYKINLLKDVSFNICDNEFVSILAPRGSGKTSLLKIIAGLEIPTNGNINTEKQKVVYIPSPPSSFPWLNVEQNISFNSNYDNDKISNIIKLVGLHGYEYHYPHNKSEGFRFRISIGRALANNSDLIVIDEPFNNLNTATRKEIYYLVRQIHKLIPIVFGTTNISEAIYLSDKVFLMKKNPGKIIDSINIELPEDRKIDIMEDKNFNSIRNKIEDIFKNKTDRMLYNFSV